MDTGEEENVARHLVTGSAGFLGSHIVKKLASMGEDVVALDVIPHRERLPDVTYIHGDVRDRDLVVELTGGVDYVHHNAALVPLTKSGEKFFEVNAGGTRNVVEGCRENGVRMLVHMSSSAIYGIPKETPITERTPYTPVEIYGRSKLEAEKIVWKYMEDGGKACCIRPRTILGGESRLGIFQILFEWISENRDIYVIGDGRKPFQFIHVDDLIDASIKAAFMEEPGLYNVGTDRFGTLREDLEKLIELVRARSRVKSLPVTLTKVALLVLDNLKLSPLAPWHYLTYSEPFVFDISLPVSKLRWKPKYSNVEMLLESYNWYLENRDGISSGDGSTHTKPVNQKVLKLLKLLS